MDTANILAQIKRRKVNKEPKPSEVKDCPNGGGKPLPPDQPRRKSSRVSLLRRKPAMDEPMNDVLDPMERAKSKLSNRFKASCDSKEYSDNRGKLLAEERKGAWNEPARRRAKPAELRANEILIKIRENERVDPGLYGNLPSEAVPESHTRDMGGRFLVNKERIDRSKVFDIARQMPKGAHLHLHFNSELPPEQLFPQARSPEMLETFHVRSTQPLCTPQDFAETEIVFNVLPKGTGQGDLFSNEYNPDWKAPDNTAWMRWADFCQKFPQDVHVEETEELSRAESWARDRMVITLGHAYHDRQTTNGAWACFNQGTRAFKGLLNYEGVYRWYIGHAIDSMIREKVMYAELRPMLLDKFIPTNDGQGKLDHKDQMTIVCQEVERKKEELRRRGELHLFPFGLKIIYCTPRSIPREKMQSELQDCLKLKLQFPDLICGFDLVGAEDRANHIGFYADLLVAFTETCKELNINIPFMFHAGETLLDTGGSHNPDNSNLYDSLLLNAKRIGHGYSLLKHPSLVKQYKDRKICLELCPISNEVLHLCGNARQHIFPELLAAGLHCTLNADNPSLFR